MDRFVRNLNSCYNLDHSKKLFLIHSPIDSARYQDAAQHYAPSLGLMALKTFIERSTLANVTLLDGVLMDTNAIINRIQEECPDIVGQSVQQVSYDNALEIASASKKVGAINVFGGHHVTQLSFEIMQNRHKIVDAIVSYDGELPLSMICQSVPFKYIPNVTYHDGTVHQNPAVPWKLDLYSSHNYNNIDLSPYIKCYTERLGFNKSKTFLRTYSHKGCGNRAGSAGCYFCGRADQGVRFKSPHNYVMELVELKERWGASAVFDVGDDIAYSKDWLQEVADCIEKFNLKLDMGCFGRACRLIDPEIAVLLKRIGVTNVIIGFESGDPNLLLSCGKGRITPNDNLRAATNLFKQGIDTCASYVIGLPGETNRSLAHTYENAECLVEQAIQYLGHKPYELVGNLFEPSPGSPAFQRIKSVFPAKYEGQDRLDLAELQSDYFRSHWNLESEVEIADFRQVLVDWARRINSLTEESDFQGFLAEEIQPQLNSLNYT